MSVQRWHGVHAGLVPDDNGPLVKFEDAIERIEILEEALRFELTHGGVNDNIAQASTSLGALARTVSDYDREPFVKIAKRLDTTREHCRNRLEAALEES